MDTKALEKFCPWARNHLKEAVDLRCKKYGLTDDLRAANPADSDVVDGTVLTSAEKRQRAELYARIEEHGYDRFLEEMAYTWFNRLAAIRYMELHDYLPGRVRMLSCAADGSFRPDCLRAAAELELPGLDRSRVFDLMDAADDEGLFRLILLAQCNELADALPDVFGHLGAADELVLPDGLLRTGDDDFLYHLVTDIPEATWDDVEILGWMYQFYNKELKDAFFASKRKAAPEDLGPATQLFTPEWIVRYMVDNSLGRLWMLNHPDSRLIERAQAENPADRLMEYYIAPDEEHEDFIRVTSPEDITFCDPACGSGHILVYAFKMLMAIYEECGYRTRDIPELILTKNLSGMEIDPRAAQIATLALAMCAREHDRRFFSRNVKANICVLHDVEINADALSLTSPLRQKPELLDTLAHLGEVGSLFAPTSDDIAALEADLQESMADDIFAAKANENVEAALSLCKALSLRFDVVVANPPYMGGSSFNPFMSKWMKKHYPDSCKDLCTAFIERGYTLAHDNGYAAMVAMQSWMFLGSFEKMRGRIIDEKTILTMAHLGTRAFDAIGGEVVSVTADVLYNSKTATKGAYFRLVDMAGGEPKRQKLLEAIQNPDCGYFYRADATTFHDIPGSPLAYWASEAMHNAFKLGSGIGQRCSMPYGFKTGDNDRFLRMWWECPRSEENFSLSCDNDVKASQAKWVPYNKGGSFRKWFGNNDYVLNYFNCGAEVLREAKTDGRSAADYNHDLFFSELITWSRISSGKLALRHSSGGSISDMTGPSIFCKSDDLAYIQGFLNSSVCSKVSEMLSATLDFQPGQVASYPLLNPNERQMQLIGTAVCQLRQASNCDWDSQETSWDFKRCSLI